MTTCTLPVVPFDSVIDDTSEQFHDKSGTGFPPLVLHSNVIFEFSGTVSLGVCDTVRPVSGKTTSTEKGNE